jgi:lipopolysaccharide/colanic/teichoic acid biosynthesis glycosyltransferase
MELATLPTTLPEKTVQRTYRHYTINSRKPVVAHTRKLEFFYIGKKSSNIDILIKAFESGYAADSPENAQAMLKRLMKQTNSVPDIVIAEASLGYLNLLQFYTFMSRDKNLSSVPFIVDASNMSADELPDWRRFRFIDDIVFLNGYTKEKLLSKVNFWKKVKQRVATQNNQPVIEMSDRIYVEVSAIVKRVFDIVVSTALLVALSPLFFAIIIALRLESKGPFFYISKRAGRGYRIFDFYKFRTMVVGADEQIDEISHLNQYTPVAAEMPVFVKINNDPRITPIGAFLRKTSLDELPQLLNVLKGDMSLVGNRPLPLYEAASLTTDEWAKRFMAPAGMTGLWQIKKRGKEAMSAEERILLDINYADKSNFLYDLWIMANTPSALIQKTNV